MNRLTMALVFTVPVALAAIAADPPASQPASVATDVKKLIADLSSDDGQKRVAATKALFALGQEALDPLKEAGAKQISPLSTADTRRLDIVYSLLDGLKPTPVAPGAGYKPDSFGLRVEDCTRDDLVAMGKKYGFTLTGDYRADGRPSCYVKLTAGKDLAEVLRAILSAEPRVISVNLNYYES